MMTTGSRFAQNDTALLMLALIIATGNCSRFANYRHRWTNSLHNKKQ